MENAYKKPQSNLVRPGEVDFTFGNLGIWRKIYLSLNWAITLIASLSMLLPLFVASTDNVPAGVGIWQLIVNIVIIVLILSYAYWFHVAVTRRNVLQLLILAIIQIVPLLNPISLVILLAIRSTSKKEVEMAAI